MRMFLKRRQSKVCNISKSFKNQILKEIFLEKATKSQEISTSNPVNNSSSWKSWGAFEMISSASKSVAKATTKMTQSLSTAIDAINIPAPEEIAKMHAEQKKSNDEDSPVSENKNTEQYVGEESSVFKLDSLLSNVGLVVSGGLDTLEGIGKKTMNILQETDPGLKDKIRGINSNRPNLSEILKEAKNSDTPNELEIKPLPLVSFEHLLEEYYGMVYLEALEVLAKQSKMKIELLLKPLTGKSLMEVEETLKEVQELCEIPDSEVVNDKITTVSLNEHLSKAVEDLNITLNFKDIVSYCLELNKFFEELEEHDSDSMTLYNKSIEALAKLCSLSLKNYQKMAELMLSLTHRSTADEVDSVTQ